MLRAHLRTQLVGNNCTPWKLGGGEERKVRGGSYEDLSIENISPEDCPLVERETEKEQSPGMAVCTLNSRTLEDGHLRARVGSITSTCGMKGGGRRLEICPSG